MVAATSHGDGAAYKDCSCLHVIVFWTDVLRRREPCPVLPSRKSYYQLVVNNNGPVLETEYTTIDERNKAMGEYVWTSVCTRHSGPQIKLLSMHRIDKQFAELLRMKSGKHGQQDVHVAEKA